MVHSWFKCDSLFLSLCLKWEAYLRRWSRLPDDMWKDDCPLCLLRPSSCCQPVRKRLTCPTQRALNSFSASWRKAWRIPRTRRRPITKWQRFTEFCPWNYWLTFIFFTFFFLMHPSVASLSSITSLPLSVGNSHLPSSPSRAEVGGQRYSEWAEEGQPERSCPVGGLLHHGQALLPLVKRQARARGGSWAFGRQVSVKQSLGFVESAGPGMMGVIPVL